MFATFFFLSLLLLLVPSVFAQSGDLAIATPVLVQCQQAQINWTDTCSGPYELLIVLANDPCGTAIVDLGYQNSTSATWNVTLAAGTQVVLYLADSEGNDGWSAPVTVGTSNDTSCLTNTTLPTSTTGTNPLVSPSATTYSYPAVSSPPAVNAGLSSNSGVLSMRPVSAIALLGTTVLAIVTFAL